MTPLGIEHMTFQFVVQDLNTLHHHVPPFITVYALKLVLEASNMEGVSCVSLLYGSAVDHAGRLCSG
jgi:hypothetical protein